MKRTYFVAATYLLGLLFGGACAEVDTRNDPERDLLDTDRAFSAMSVKEGMAEAFRTYLLEDAIQLPEGDQPVIGRNLIYEGLRSAQEGYVLEWEPQFAEVADSGDLGWTWGRYRYYARSGEDTSEVRHGKYLNIWKRTEAGEWRVAVDMGNENPAPDAGVFDVGVSRDDLRSSFGEPASTQRLTKQQNAIFGPIESFWSTIAMGDTVEIWSFPVKGGSVEFYFVNGSDRAAGKGFAPEGVVY